MAQCTAKSTQTQQRCRQSAIRGGMVCRFHGGGAPQVKAAAQARLAALVDPALGTLGRLVRGGKKTPHAVQLGAAKDVLDRNGLLPPKTAEKGDFTLQELLIAYRRVTVQGPESEGTEGTDESLQIA